MTTTRDRAGLFRRAAGPPEITTPPAGTVLPPHARTGAPDIPVTSATPALPPGWEPAEAGGDAADGAPPPQGPPAPDDDARTGGAGGAPRPSEGRTHTPQPAPGPDVQIQVNALQALCRQAFGFRLAMIALATPSALLNAAPGWSTRLVALAVVATFMASYVLFRDWERFGPLLLRHPTLLAADTLFGALLLISAGPGTTLAYVSVCTPLLAGLIYGWRGAAVFASLQGLILLLVHAALDSPRADPADALLLPGLCVIAGAVGSSLRNLMLRLGTATRALTTVQARLAVTEAVSAERARLAREMHDSVAKTLHGVALAADGLTGTASAPHPDPARVRQQAELVARSARRAAAESRELLADLRRESDPDQGTDVLVELAARTRDFTSRTGVPATYRPTGGHAVPPVPPAVARQLLTIASEAMENAHRHARPAHVDVHAGVHGDLLVISVYDDGTGLPPGTDLEQLRRAGHFGLVGMVERAASVGARIRIGRGAHTRGTEVRLELPLAAVTTPTEATP
ncbi:sensor histidine kinase [Streptomyces sp. NA02536]|uniref:sensor histidine kinase n=1 Tax=Streptomyces TaxID=1883 RepID=UPI0015900A6A|nr:histidine kinase [Streptomyces sp. NA02536]QKW02350.1 two-component sensor histidine kinase [Streptomyces sp. NA02536]